MVTFAVEISNYRAVSLGKDICKSCKSCKYPQVSNYMNLLFNMRIDSETCPDIFKVSKITPIFKKRSPHKIINHCLISILCHLAKSFVEIIYDRNHDLLFDDALLSDNQFGFRKCKTPNLLL